MLRRSVVGEAQCGLLERERIEAHKACYAIELLSRLHKLVARKRGAQQDMATVVQVISLLNKFYDMESELCLDNLRYLARLEFL